MLIRLRAAGYPSKANAILYAARQRSRRTAWERGEGKPREWWRSFGLLLLEWTIGYGLGAGYFRVVWWFAGFTLLGFLVLFGSSAQATWDLSTCVWASFDHVLPLVKLNQGHEQFILANAPGWKTAYFYLQKVIGYLLGGFLGAGLAGLTQKS